MGSLGTIWAELGLKLNKFDEGLRNAEAKIKTAEQKLEGLQKASERLSSAGKKLTLGISLPLAAAGGAVIKFAMDAEESENLFKESMGNMADAARKWSEELSDSLGLNEYELRKNVGTFNVMLNSMGMGEQAAYGMATSLTKLAYDMASFYNMKPEEAFQKLQAGITGEIEPLKRIGILVNENTIKIYAYTNGIAKQGEKLTEQQKITARYGAIIEQTAKAQGDLERTMDSTTNRVRILKSRAVELAIDFGTLLIPMFEKGIDVLDRIVGWFESLDESQKKMVINMGMATAAIGPFLLILGKLGSAVITLSKAKSVLAGSVILQKFIPAMGAATTAAEGTTVATAGLSAASFALAGKLTILAGAAWLIYDTFKQMREGTLKTVDSFSLMGQSVSETRKQVDKMTYALSEEGKAYKEMTESVQGYTDSVEAQRLQRQQEIQEVNNQKRLIEEYKKKIQEWTKAVEEAGERAKDAGEKIREKLSTAIENLSIKAEIARAKFDLLKAKMGENTEQSQLMKAEVETLNTQYDLQTEKVATLQTAYEKMKTIKGENVLETQRLYLELLQEQKALQDLQNKIIQVNKSYQEAAQAKYEFSVADGKVTVKQGNVSFTYNQSEARKHRQQEFEKNKNEIAEIARRQGVDMGVAHDMWKQNRIDKMMGKVAKYATGGMITRPVLMMDLLTGKPAGVAGEAGSEAIVPLRSNNQGPIQIIVELDGRVIAEKTLPHMHRVMALKGV